MVIGYLTGDILGIERQLWGAVTGILFTGLSFVLIRVIEPLLKKSNQFTPKMVSIINTNKERSTMASKNIIDLTKDSFDGEVLKSEHPVWWTLGSLVRSVQDDCTDHRSAC